MSVWPDHKEVVRINVKVCFFPIRFSVATPPGILEFCVSRFAGLQASDNFADQAVAIHFFLIL